MEHHYNPQLLADLIRSAIGHRTQKWFAKEIGLSTAHLSRILHGKYPAPPRKSTLKAIAACSEGRVSEAALFEACGYETNTAGAPAALPADLIRKRMEATILSELRASHSSLFVLPGDGSCDLCVRLDGETQPVWKFFFLDPKTKSLTDPNYCELITRLVFMRSDPGCKTSIVTADKSSFDKLSSNPAPNLDLDVSFILIDHDHLEITKEKWISRRDDRLNAYAKKLHF